MVSVTEDTGHSPRNLKKLVIWDWSYAHEQIFGVMQSQCATSVTHQKAPEACPRVAPREVLAARSVDLLALRRVHNEAQNATTAETHWSRCFLHRFWTFFPALPALATWGAASAPASAAAPNTRNDPRRDTASAA
jgi:hypothetical protein